MATIILLPHIITNYKPKLYINSFSMNKTVKPRLVHVSSTVALTRLTVSSLRATAKQSDQNPIIQSRRSGNYKPDMWDFEYVQSFNTSEYSGERYNTRASEVKEQVKMMLDRAMEPVDLLEFIDDLQRLGVSYHFEDKIKQILTKIYNQKHLENRMQKESHDLYTAALEFRLMRQHGFKVHQEIFDCFKNEKGEFETSHTNDIKGLLQLYEASYMLTEDENTLEMAREFSTKILQNSLENNNNDNNNNNNNNEIDDENYLTLMVRSALESPLHWRVERPNARWFINVYEKRPKMNTVVLELAKLDFNIIQAMYVEELKEVSRWWKKTCLAEKLPFARDRMVESYVWSIDGLFGPKCKYSRILEAKLIALISMIDDVYDIYGTLEELQFFTDAIQRWDINAIGELPYYMQLSFVAVNNCINELAYDVLKDKGFLVIPYLKKSWTDLCNAYFQEAKWYYQGYTPTLEEYINNAWLSISIASILPHIFFTLANPIDEDTVHRLYKYHDLIRWSTTAFRLVDDLGTAPPEMERGDVPKSIQCYMNEAGVTQKEAEEYIQDLIYETWKKVNKVLFADDDDDEISLFPHGFVSNAVGLTKTAQYFYQHGDGHGISNPHIQQRISSLLFEPIIIT